MAAALVLPSAGAAESLILKNGNTITGSVESETSDRVTVRTPSGVVSVSRATIAVVRRAASQVEAVQLFQETLLSGNIPAAFGSLSPASGPVLEQMDGVLVRHSDVLFQPEHLTKANARLFLTYVLRRDKPAGGAIKVLLARFLAASGDSDGARQVLSALDPKYLTGDQTTRATVAALLSTHVTAALAGKDPDSGLESLELLAKVAPERVSSSTVVLLRLNEVRRLTEKGALLPAAETLGVYVLPSAPATALSEIPRLLKRAQESTTASTVAEVCDAIHRHFSASGHERELAPVYQAHIDSLLRLQRLPEARAVAARLSQVAPDEGAPFEHRVELEIQKGELRPDDILGRYRLGVWAKGVGLSSEARALLRSCLYHPDLKENAQLQLNLLETEDQREQFENACRIFEEKRYYAAQQALESFRSAYPGSPYGQKAGELVELCRYHIWNQAKRRPEEAEVLRQNAERLILQSRYDEALALLNQLEVDFHDTAAAREASKLREQIERKSPRKTQAVGSARVSSEKEARRMEEIRAMAEDLARRSSNSERSGFQP